MLDFLVPELRQTHFPRVNQRKLQTALGKLVSYYNTSAGSHNRRKATAVSVPSPLRRERMSAERVAEALAALVFLQEELLRVISR